jgi:catechol 2,3-dioxygenase-like lactoylglutathione lyase family enzyme
MLADSKAFNGFAVNDLDKAKQFYGETLGLRSEVLDEEHGLITLHLAGDRDTLVYLSPDMTAPSYTILNFEVDDIDQAVDDLTARGVTFEQYGNPDLPQDDKGVMREGGPLIAWFKDPAGNTLSVLQQR